MVFVLLLFFAILESENLLKFVYHNICSADKTEFMSDCLRMVLTNAGCSSTADKLLQLCPLASLVRCCD